MTPEYARIVKKLGFEVCEFGPDSDPCECCKGENLQLYFQGPTDAGRYLCLECILAEHFHNESDLVQVYGLEKMGHTSHCACRQVWGDGECECMPPEQRAMMQRAKEAKKGEGR